MTYVILPDCSHPFDIYALLLLLLQLLSGSVEADPVPRLRWQPTRPCSPGGSLGKNTGVGCPFLLLCMKVKSENEVAQWCPTLSHPMDCSRQAPLSMGFSRQNTLVSGHSLVVKVMKN